MRILKAFLILLTLISFNLGGCALFTQHQEATLCQLELPNRPLLQDIPVADQQALYLAAPNAFRAMAVNDLLLKQHIVLLESLIQAHNTQFAECL